MTRLPETFREIRRRVLGRRILQLRFANTLSYGDIRKVMIQLDNGEWLEVSGMPGLTIELAPLLHPDANKLCVGGEGIAESPPSRSTEGCVSEEFLSAQEEIQALRNRLFVMQDVIDYAYNHAKVDVREYGRLKGTDGDPYWFLEAIAKILQPHRSGRTELPSHISMGVEDCLSKKLLSTRAANKTLRDRISAMQEAVDSAYRLLRERHDPCWLMKRAERILNPHRTK